MKGHAFWLLGVLLLTGCDGITVPRREPNEVFEFRLLTGGDSLVLRWPNGSRIRVLQQPSGDGALDSLLAQAFQHAVHAWEDVSLYSDYRFEAASMVEAADVILTWAGVALPVNTTNCTPGGSTAFTTFCLTAERDRLEPFPLPAGSGMPSRVRFLVTVRPGPTQTAERMRMLVTHEFGHVLGLIQHSPNQTDIMFADPTRDTPNARDRATLQVLYQTRADIIP